MKRWGSPSRCYAPLMTKPLLPIGIDDFRKLRQQGCWYADKSGMIVELVTQPTEAVLLPRPRRFGKSLAMSMLKNWFEPSDEDRSALFADLEVWQAGEQVRGHFQKHPVISLSFKDVKTGSWEECLGALSAVVAAEFRRHESVLQGLDSMERDEFQALRTRSADRGQLERSLVDLSRWLHQQHGAPVVILIDEYDTPIHAGFAHGYYEQVVGFFRNFLSAGYKGNEHLFRGCLTGILRVAKEGLFSGLNNVKDYGILERRYAPYFGLTEPEVQGLLDELGVPERIDDMRCWYNGYLFGDGLTIYNPWSVLCYASDLPSMPEPYWKNTSGDDVLRRMLMDRAVLDTAEVEGLLGGAELWKVIDKHVELRSAYTHEDAAWGLLLFSGYLNAVEARQEPDGRVSRRLELPNREVRIAIEDAISSWTQLALGGRSPLEAMLRTMLAGRTEEFARLLSGFARDALSFHDTGCKRPEAVFHAFVLGMLVQLAPRYRVRSNREAGYGRADILISPVQPGEAGIVLEFKVVDRDLGDEPETTLDEALAQVQERRYAAELRAEGVSEVLVYGAALDGKRVWMRRGPPGSPSPG